MSGRDLDPIDARGAGARLAEGVRAVLTLAAIVLNTMFWAMPIYAGILVKLVTPSQPGTATARPRTRSR